METYIGENQLKLFSLHIRENNPDSQAHLNENRVHFNSQCQRLYKGLMGGCEYNADNAKDILGIRHLPRRKKDLTDKGIKISGKEWKYGLLLIWMTKEDIEFNRNNFNI